MSKIFRLHTGGTEDIKGWTEINGHLNFTAIDTITDPSNSTAQIPITSIPSPFARMDLVKTAFKYVQTVGEIDGNTIYHRLVSDALDIAEIFFHIDALKDKVEIIEWQSGLFDNGGEQAIDPESDLGRVIGSKNVKHQLLGETLKMFLFQDASAFQFGKLKNIYLINYKKGPDMMNVIGGTSPTTMFFSSANDLSFVDITLSDHQVFGDQFCSLVARGRDFVGFLFMFRAAYPEFNEVFPELNDYMDLCFPQLDETLRTEIREYAPTDYAEYFKPIAVGSETNRAEIHNFLLLTSKGEITGDEDFTIAATQACNEGILPLVLPIEPFDEGLSYAGGTWKKNFHLKVPKKDSRPMDERTLPNQEHIIYPYLTVSDLLEPYLIKLAFPIDKERFFDGFHGIRGNDEAGYLLPVKKKYLEYFQLRDLKNFHPDGSKYFEFKKRADGVTAYLRIPIQKDRYVTFSRTYSENKQSDGIALADEKGNFGVIIENQFTLAIYPFFKTSHVAASHYRIMLAEKDDKPSNRNNEYSLSFYKDAPPHSSLKAFTRNRSSKALIHGVTSRYYILEDTFDFMEVTHNTASGLVVPLFPPVPQSSKAFRFAMDFGTTNTHIEYRVDNAEAVPFEIKDDLQLATLHAPGAATDHYFSENAKSLGLTVNNLTKIMKEEFIPLTITNSSEYKFPQRTIIFDNGLFNPDQSTYALADFNIPFWYLKESYNIQNSHGEITPNLKWSDFQGDGKLKSRTKGFLKQLMLMMRNKVLANDGDLSSTEVVWFYPASMPEFRRGFLEDSISTYYQRYFPGAEGLYKMSESFAPFEYYKNKSGIVALAKPVVCIDIGGGTSDVVVYKNNTPNILTSFRFASNSLFGDGYGHTSSENGFVRKYEKIIKESLSNTEGQQLTGIYDTINTPNCKSIELIEFFFSLEENKLIRDNRIPLAFSKLLAADTDLKIVPLIYFAAMIYHIAELMKQRSLDMPRYITFSGNGSKIIPIISGKQDLSKLVTFSKIIFKSVYGQDFDGSLDVKVFPNPKEITCKGGLEVTNYAAFNDLEARVTTVLLGDAAHTVLPDKQITYTQLQDEKLIDTVNDHVMSFIDLFFSWHKDIDYYNSFGISSNLFDGYSAILKEDMKNYLLAGVAEKLAEAKDNLDINLEETLFFYPLTGALNKLAYHIYKTNVS